MMPALNPIVGRYGTSWTSSNYITLIPITPGIAPYSLLDNKVPGPTGAWFAGKDQIWHQASLPTSTLTYTFMTSLHASQRTKLSPST